MISIKTVSIYTDGACANNPGPGGWGVVMIYKDHVREYIKEFSGFAPHTTNQRMELTAAVKGLHKLKTNTSVNLYSDSAYLINAFQKNWFQGWLERSWKNAKNQPVSNRDLWEQLLELSKKHRIEWIKVKGHSNNKWNNRCDQLAREAITQGLDRRSGDGENV